MVDALVVIGILLGGWTFSRIMLKEPILPWKEKKANTSNQQQVKGKKTNNKNNINPYEKEAEPFKELFPNVLGIESHMLRYGDNEFTMFVEVEPVNYFLRDPMEQEVIDMSFETWLAAIDYPVRIYLQNRFVDLTEQIENIQKQFSEADDLNSEAQAFGRIMIEDLIAWQSATPRYETKRYILFDYKVDVKEVKVSEDESLDEKIVEKAFNELIRRYQLARRELRRGEMAAHLLTDEGITEVIYYAFNRRKALKNRFRDIERYEKNALYVTADQSPERIAAVKKEVERVRDELENVSSNSDSNIISEKHKEGEYVHV